MSTSNHGFIQTRGACGNSGFNGFPNSIPAQQNAVQLSWSNNGDTNGAFYYIGTQGGAQAWTNPVTASYVSAASSGGSVAGTLSQIVGRASNSGFSSQTTTSNSYVQFDLQGRKLILKGYNHRNRNNSADTNTMTMRVLASSDGIGWREIGIFTHANTAADGWNYISVSDETEGYQFFRFNCVTNTNNNAFISIAELELYGTLINP